MLSSALPDFEGFAEQLREKWRELPATRMDRNFSKEMLRWSDGELLEYWEECRRQTTTPDARGWYQELYKDAFAGKRMADIGPGVGIDGIWFAQHGAHVTFVDIVIDNLKLLKRISKLKGVEADFYYVDDFFEFHFDAPFDVMMFIGSFHNAPFEFSQREAEALLPFLKPDGRILLLAYPKERYEYLGARDFAEFGRMCDGERTPWCEWYDDQKILALFGSDFRLNWSRNFGDREIEFNWFDLTRVAAVDDSGSYVPADCVSIPRDGGAPVAVPMVRVQDLHQVLGFDAPVPYPHDSLVKPLSAWKMEVDDSPIFRHIYRSFRPRRHLEIGTWQGTGALYCLEECDATVWTLNLPLGVEERQPGTFTYSHYDWELPAIRTWAHKIGMPDREIYKTDTLGFIGRKYLAKGYGKRVCQIYADSLEWDTSNYPHGFFDTVLLDGGHSKQTVLNDTRKVMDLLRPGGLILWHDFCPPAVPDCASPIGVQAAVAEMWYWLGTQTSRLFWIYPSWILVGVKADSAGPLPDAKQEPLQASEPAAAPTSCDVFTPARQSALIPEMLQQAEEMASSGQLREAEEIAERILRDHDAGCADAHNLMGFIHFQREEMEAALHCFERAHALNRTNPEIAKNLAYLCLAFGRMETARVACDMLLRTVPHDPDVRELAARCGAV